MLTASNAMFRDHKLIREVGDQGWTHHWRYVDSLRNYLLLTCFDVLGQTREWISFDGWLRAKRCAGERANVNVARLVESNASEVCLAMHEEYIRIYGVKSAFIHFVHNVLTPDARTRLYQSIRLPTPMGATQHIDCTKLFDTGRDNFLFQIRNRFTHSAQNFGDASGGVFDPDEPSFNSAGAVVQPWVPIQSDFAQPGQTPTFVRDWPRVLVDTVRSSMV